MGTSVILPLKDINGSGINLARLEQIGFAVSAIQTEVGCVVAKLPEGWQIIPDKSDTFNIIDSCGHWRAYVSPAYGDEPGYTTLFHRYWPMPGSNQERSSSVTYQVVDFGAMALGTPENKWPTVFSVSHEFWGDGERTGNYREMDDLAIKEILAWVNEHYPDWHNPAAYWN